MSKWIEQRRRPVGIYCSGPVCGNHGYVEVLYEVSEMQSPGHEMRTRTVHGPAIRHTAYAQGLLYEIFWKLFNHFITICIKIEEDEV
jgi:hypothetical protein